ncbi:Myosin regulatory light chain 1 [Elsinoe australis]|uniref:Myosin regulatory light chain 1 n=1 Tax=Elsinoe australis TaxID=40998 RepID=A0A2P7ZU26_9PEZI|nr:Myosin regulatory light chain 1 [Elsinoe australis]
MSFSPRQSPFKRPESPGSKTPSTVRAASPVMTMSSPTKGTQPSSSPMLGTERQSPFVRRPSQLSMSDRPKSPFARAPSRLSVAEPASRSESPSDADPFVVKSPPLSSTNNSRPNSAFNSRPSSTIEPYTSRPSSTVEPFSSRPASAVEPLRTSPPQPSAPTTTIREPLIRTSTSSTLATVRPAHSSPHQATTTTSKPTLPAFANAGNYSHIPAPLLRTMRESFEVLDATSSNTITRSDLTTILEQLGLDASPQFLNSFFPPSSGGTLNLAKFLDMLTEPMRELSEKEELMAAFGAFDVDDSGQIDLAEIRDAVLRTAPEGGIGARLSEREVDGILGEFAGRRAFGAKGVSGKEVGGRGEVFRYRDFMASVGGSGGQGEGVQA